MLAVVEDDPVAEAVGVALLDGVKVPLAVCVAVAVTEAVADGVGVAVMVGTPQGRRQTTR